MFDQLTSGLTEFRAIVAALAVHVHPGFVCVLAVSAQRTHSICQVAMCLRRREERTKQEKLPFGQRCFKPSNCQ